MKIKFYAHASFRLEADGLAVVTDPYTPGPNCSGFDPINEPADIVLMSSATDDFHSDPSHITGEPIVVNTLELPAEGRQVKGLTVTSFPAMESPTYDYGRDPDANALYHFELGGVRVLHMGDIGHAMSEGQLEALKGKVDLLLALTGDHATIALPDLDHAIDVIGPRAVIPMHYYSERGVLPIEPVESFVKRRPAETVTWVKSSEFELTPEKLARAGEPPRVYVLEQSR